VGTGARTATRWSLHRKPKADGSVGALAGGKEMNTPIEADAREIEISFAGKRRANNGGSAINWNRAMVLERQSRNCISGSFIYVADISS
jgi:hypothetical protein